MADIYQPHEITTIHKFNSASVADIENKLQQFAERHPIALVLPALKRDFYSEANRKIIQTLEQIDYIQEVVYAIGDFNSPAEFAEARQMVSGITGMTVTLFWVDGPRVSNLFASLGDEGLYLGPPGKGRTVWMASGYVLSRGNFASMVLHDCDIVTYDRELLARLCLPVTVPHFDFEFCKGFYARFQDKLYGRVCRLFVFPLLEALLATLGPHPFLVFLSSFRYPLSGEFAISTHLAQTLRIPADWGLEIGTLAEVYRKCTTRRVCQVDLCDRFDHKHQDLSAEDKGQGLHRMSVDIASSIFTNLAHLGVNLEDKLKIIRASYLRYAQDMIKKYDSDAFTNNLSFDRHQEESAVETFCQGLAQAAEGFLVDPLGGGQIPNWSRVTAAVADFPDKLLEAVRLDNEMA